MQIIQISKENISKTVNIAAVALLKGKVIVFPTDTVYGFVADATNKKAVEKIFLIKGRKEGKPLPIFVNDIAMAKQLAHVSLRQENILKKSWPGKVTFVLESRRKLPKETGTEEYIGLRIPNYKVIQEILKQIKKPLTGTSANLAGKPSLITSKEVIEVFQKRKYKPDLVFDAGNLSRTKPSKVIDITKVKPIVLRK